jgi:hypothetical protein
MTYQAWFAKALVTMTIAILISGGLFAGSAAACGFPGQFGGCLAHGNFDPSVRTNSADFGCEPYEAMRSLSALRLQLSAVMRLSFGCWFQ